VSSMLGLGLLLGAAVFSFGLSCGCKKAEILAINGESMQSRMDGFMLLMRIAKPKGNFGLDGAALRAEVVYDISQAFSRLC
jgi:hypothetical protein